MNTLSRLFRIARLTWLEGSRSRFFALASLLLLLGSGLGLFAGSLAVTESTQTTALVLAAFLRLGAVFLVGMAVVTAMVREMDDKVSEIFLALSLPRAIYYLGRLTGFCLLALSTALLLWLPAALASSWWESLAWGLSLGCELLLVAAAALLFVLTFHQTTTALAALVAFYLLARSLEAFQLMAGGVFHVADTWSNQAIRLLLEGLSLILPGLHRFTQSEWLVHGGGWPQLGELAAETAIYFMLLTVAGLVDLHRKNF